MAKYRLQPHSKLTDNFLYSHVDSASRRVFYARSSTFSKLAIPKKNGKDNLPGAALEGPVAKKIKYINKITISNGNSNMTDC